MNVENSTVVALYNTNFALKCCAISDFDVNDAPER